MDGATTTTAAWPEPGRSTTVTLGAAGVTWLAASLGAASDVQAPKFFSARAKASSGAMSPVMTRMAFEGWKAWA